MNLYLYLRANHYPLGYRVLCMNCNFAIGHYGYCPHCIKEVKDALPPKLPKLSQKYRKGPQDSSSQKGLSALCLVMV
jgi:hypothetical protein